MTQHLLMGEQQSKAKTRRRMAEGQADRLADRQAGGQAGRHASRQAGRHGGRYERQLVRAREVTLCWPGCLLV